MNTSLSVPTFSISLIKSKIGFCWPFYFVATVDLFFYYYSSSSLHLCFVNANISIFYNSISESSIRGVISRSIMLSYFFISYVSRYEQLSVVLNQNLNFLPSYILACHHYVILDFRYILIIYPVCTLGHLLSVYLCYICLTPAKSLSKHMERIFSFIRFVI